MTPAILYAITGVLLFCLGLRGLLADPHLLRKILALNIMSTGVFLLLVGIAYRDPELPPDPVPHAMVLTGIVVAVSATALALVLMRRLFDLTGATALDETD